MAGDIRPDKLAQMERQVQPLCAGIDTALKAAVGERVGFALLVFAFDGPEATYGSNAQRDDMIKALRECADRLEHRRDALPGTDGKGRGRG